MKRDPKPRIVLLGIDAGDLNFIKSNLGELPTLARSLGHGSLKCLDTTSGLLTGSVWPTFYTGTMPGEHGIYHHLQWDPETMRVRRVSADWLYAEPFWYALARRGIKVTALDVPMTFPGRVDSGVEVINWGSHDQLGPYHCNQKELQRALRKHFGDHPMGAEIPVQKNAGQLELIRDRLIKGAARKGELIRWLMNEKDCDLFIAVFGETHRGGHMLWPEDDAASVIPVDAMLEVYKAVDRALEKILQDIDPQSTQVVLFALHGMESNRSQEHFVAPIMDRANAGFFQRAYQDSVTESQQHSVMRTLRERLPARLQHAIAQRVPVAVRDWVVSRAVDGGHQWSATPGLALLADYNGYLRLNTAGRERDGVLRGDDSTLQQYTDWLRQCFQSFSLPQSQEPLVAEVVPMADAMPGARSAYLPDLTVTWQPERPASTIESPLLGRITTAIDTGRSGNHQHQGFGLLIGADDSARLSSWHKVQHIRDLATFVSHAFEHAH